MGGFIVTPLLLQEELGYGESEDRLSSIARPLTSRSPDRSPATSRTRIGERKNAVSALFHRQLDGRPGPPSVSGRTDLVILGALALVGHRHGHTSPAMAAAIATGRRTRPRRRRRGRSRWCRRSAWWRGIQILQTVQARARRPSAAIGSIHDAYLVGAGAAGLGVLGACFVRSTSRRDREARSGRIFGRPHERSAAAGRAVRGRASGLLAVMSLILSAIAWAPGSGADLLHGHELRHVALHLDLAGHEGLHAGLRVLIDEDRLGGRPVDRDGEVGALELTEVHLDSPSEVSMNTLIVAVAERRVGDHLVHAHRVGRRAGAGVFARRQGVPEATTQAVRENHSRSHPGARNRDSRGGSRNHRIDEAEAASLRKRFSDEGFMELTGAIGYYSMLAMTVNA